MLFSKWLDAQHTELLEKRVGKSKSNDNLTCIQPAVTGNEAGYKFARADRTVAAGLITAKTFGTASVPISIVVVSVVINSLFQIDN